MIKKKLITLFISVFVLFSFCGCLSEFLEDEPERYPVEQEDEIEDDDTGLPDWDKDYVDMFMDLGPITDFSLKTIEGTEISADIFKNSEVTMLNIWGTFCGPCIQEMPGLGEIAAERDESEFQVIGVICDVESESSPTFNDAIDIINDTKAFYTHVIPSGDFMYKYMSVVDAVPTDIFVDSDGNILYVYRGGLSKSDFDDIIDAVLLMKSNRSNE